MESSSIETVTAAPVSSMAKKRWKILSRAVVNAAKSSTAQDHDLDGISVRRFSSFHLFQTESVSKTKVAPNDFEVPPVKKRLIDKSHSLKNGHPIDDASWIAYRLPNLSSSTLPAIHLRFPSPKFRARDLANFGDVDNTGNVCVWPAEEVMAFYLARRPELVRGKTVVELGGGMTCLAGLVAARWSGARRVVLTDGNVKAVENVEKILNANELSLELPQAENDDVATSDPSSPPPCSTRLLRWDAVDDHASDLHHVVDVILSADCLFFDAFRQSFVDTLDFLLADDDDAVALIFAPRRKKTMEDLIARAEKQGFAVSVEEDYDEVVSNKKTEAMKEDSFDANIHYPLLVSVRRRRPTNGASKISHKPIDQ